MSKLTTQQIRSTFIDYFKDHGHTHVPSSSLVPHNDPSLMFVNSGMVQFKNVFTGVETREYKRATTSQKSVRAGGKHNDLDNVGYTARHHTFFEMLGNFSFGDYFKEEAISYAWRLLTDSFSIPKEKLYVTVYHDDEEAVSHWKKISGFGDDRIIRIKTSDNFWSMGDTGPCGPCSEIFYDHGEHIPGGLPGTPEQDGDRFIEIWNLVFMQYEQVDKDTRILLPNKSVDTGMGLERISAVVQGVHDNYDTDMFQDLIGHAESILKVPAKGEALFSYRVIADHLRSSAFLIADGVMPSNEGRGYVLRRIMRRAMRHAHQLGAKEPLMYKLLPKLEDLFGHPYTELTRAEEFITSILKQEEERFKYTLDRGLKLLEDETSSIPKGGNLSGDLAFKLYDTYGFPLDLTEDILKKQKISVDHAGFDKHMQIQKERARKSWAGSGESKTDTIWFDIASEFGATEFLGYSLDSAEGKVVALVQKGKEIDQVSDINAQFTLIANQTPFYGESGGQMGDIGIIESTHCRIEVVDTLKYLGKIIGHVCVLKEGVVSKNDEIKMAIDSKYRSDLKMHHSATHILHAVMRDVLGRHVTQKGSLVAKDKLRFDFSHPKALTKAEIRLIEQRVNQIISHNSQVITKLMSADHAIESGAMALFGEKYDSEVRVVSLGPITEENNPYSFELCGGTHVKRTGDIGAFKILSEGAIAAGIRRIEAICGEYAFASITEDEELLDKVIDTLKSNKVELVQKVEGLLGAKKNLEKQLENMHMDKMVLNEVEIKQKSKKIDGARLLYTKFDNIDAKMLRISAENLAKSHDDLVIVYVSKNNDKLSIVVAVSKAVSVKYNAGYIAKEASAFVGGSGGGQAMLAQAGGTNVTKLSALEGHIIALVKG
ncbi:MAG: alanine--tRNA ligase [Rickettsiaceae bacterium]|nr:alanine--tRNA ligase [Rickettsiaceae bacterium]